MATADVSDQAASDSHPVSSRGWKIPGASSYLGKGVVRPCDSAAIGGWNADIENEGYDL